MACARQYSANSTAPASPNPYTNSTRPSSALVADSSLRLHEVDVGEHVRVGSSLAIVLAAAPMKANTSKRVLYSLGRLGPSASLGFRV